MKSPLSLLVLLLCGGCAVSSSSPDSASELAGQPSWFPLGGEVYHENSRFEVQQEVLQFQPQPRWFLGFSRTVSKEEFEAWKKKQDGLVAVQLPEEIGRQVPSSPPYPRSVEDVCLQDQGATLHLAIEEADKPGVLLFTLTLSAGDRVIRREVEHRWTNVLPFLFAFFANGKAISRGLDSFGRMGGANTLVELVPAGSQKRWRLRVDAGSIGHVVASDVRELAVVACFSERQHVGFLPGSAGELSIRNPGDGGPQILIRSNIARLRRSGVGWAASQNR